LLRTLIHYRRINLAVILGAAVATAVLSGALLVGDSVRGSLRDLTLERLGRIDHAMLSQALLRADLADDLASADPGVTAVAPIISLRGSAVDPDSGARARNVAINGIDGRFAALFDGGESLDLNRRSGQVFPSVVINEALRREIDIAVGDPLLLSFPRFSNVPRGSLVGDKDPDDVLASIRLTVTRVIDGGAGHFGLSPHQLEPANVFVELEELQKALDVAGEVNTLLVASDSSAADLDARLADLLTLEDQGLTIDRADAAIIVESREFVMRPPVVETILDAAAATGAPATRVRSYLANTMVFGENVLPYSLVAALDTTELIMADGSETPVLGDDDILLNTWAAEDLGVAVGDTVEMTYYVVGPREELAVENASFTVQGVVAIEGLAADPGLTPDYPGIQEAEDISGWDPPFPVDLSLIRERDEDYWDRYRATPKAFVADETGRRLWTSRFGSTTSVRVGPAPERTLERTEGALRASLAKKLRPDSVGFRFRPVRTEGLEAATGATDFAGLFIGFSLFLIVSSALIVGLLFSLGVEQRAGEIGLLRAVGYRLRKVRRRLLAEGLILAAIGAVIGVAAGVGYAGLLMTLLRTLWVDAVGSTRLFLHVEPVSLAMGWGIAVVVVIASIAGTVFRLSKLPPPALLAGATTRPARRRSGIITHVLALGSLVGALALVIYAVATGTLSSPGLAFGTGALLLVGGLARFSLWCRGSRARSKGRGVSSRSAMAARNTSWSPGRSMLSVALVASACFVIVAVASNRERFGEELDDRQSGTGGFRLVAASDVPLHQDLSREDDRFDLGFPDSATAVLDDAEIYPFRVLPGEDASCLNLYQPEKPGVLGVTPDLISRGGFGFTKTLGLPAGEDNPWTLLDGTLEPGVIPAFADANSAQWILHVGLGRDVVLEDESGNEVRLRLVGLMGGSIFQSELLISEENFLDVWPGRSGYGYFLIDAPPDTAPEISRTLESTLGPFGFDVSTTRDKLAGYKVVEHTYLSTFQMLGGLGLLLGTVGLGIVLMRNVIERRGELATLRAFGFRRSSLAWMVLAENAFLLTVGMGIGTVSALVAVAPRLATIHVPWASLLGTLAIVLAVGMLSSVLAVRGALRIPLLPALKAER
jgi:ABC-type lipoprotein release transport system permease subunit